MFQETHSSGRYRGVQKTYRYEQRIKVSKSEKRQNGILRIDKRGREFVLFFYVVSYTFLGDGYEEYPMYLFMSASADDNTAG